MFRTGLLVSTAMTAVSLLLSGTPTGTYAETNMHVRPLDANARFVCTYGQFRVSVSSNSSSGPWFGEWTHVAVPVKGHGQTVSQIRVVEGRDSKWYDQYYFTAGVYSNSPSGLPGNLIASGHSSMANPSCEPVTISIPPTKLKRNTKYWIEETAWNRDNSQPVSFFWVANPNAKHKAYIQTHWRECYSGNCYSSTSPWTKQTKGPYLKLR